jgi:hypothetical protein
MLRWNIKKWVVEVWIGLIWLRIETGEGDNEHSGSMKCGEFLD